MRCPYCSKEIEDEVIICGHCGRAVVEPASPSFTEVSVFDQEQVLFEAKDENRQYTWQPACVELDPVARALTIYGSSDRTPEITIPVSEIARCEIIEREDIPRDMSRTSGGGISGGSDLGDLVLGLLLIVFLAVFEAIIEDIRAKKTKVPVLRLTHSRGDYSDQGWVIDLRSDKRGNKGQAATLEMARHIVAILCLTGYGGTIPEELGLPKDLEAFVKETRVTQEQLARTIQADQPLPSSPREGETGTALTGERGRISARCLKWSSIAGLLMGLLYSMLAWDLPGGPPDLWKGILVFLPVWAIVGTAVGAAVQWRKDRNASMVAGAGAASAAAVIAASVSHFFISLMMCCW